MAGDTLLCCCPVLVIPCGTWILRFSWANSSVASVPRLLSAGLTGFMTIVCFEPEALAPLSVVDSGLNHDDDTLGVSDLPQREPLGFGEGTPADGAARIGRGVSEDKLSEKEPWPEWYRSGHTRATISLPLPEVWFRVVDTVCSPRAGAVCRA